MQPKVERACSRRCLFTLDLKVLILQPPGKMEAGRAFQILAVRIRCPRIPKGRQPCDDVPHSEVPHQVGGRPTLRLPVRGCHPNALEPQ
ncbi:jg15567 [Pararge aegeria aegeria]|uniref:Jg15567 protein n=1 Tax=Pararge aegeria aegeria TaxID=348720 RepID=A0A8S4S0E3_9NEOP|nr:jg15567 [Pararge aegeria aegeria]